MNEPILLVENDPGDRELVLIALEGCARIAAAADGPQALEHLLADAPRLVILDLNLPGMHGLEVLERIRSDGRTRRQPVVIFSSSGAERDRKAAYDLGVNSYVQKPAGFVEFSRVVKELARYWLDVNLPPPGRVSAAAP